jgi:hypothetical protein
MQQHEVAWQEVIALEGKVKKLENELQDDECKLLDTENILWAIS